MKISASACAECLPAVEVYGQTLKHFAQIEPIHLGRLDQAHDHGGALTGHLAARDAPRRPVILDYLTRLDLEAEDAKRFHLGPDIPAKKLAAALSGRRFAQTAPPSAVHLLVDDTTFRGGANGLLITDKYVSFKSLFMDSQDFRYESSGGCQWQGGFQARKGSIHRQHLTCQTFSFFSASGVQKLVWALNNFFDDRLQWHLAMAEGGNVDSQFFLGGSLEDTATSRIGWPRPQRAAMSWLSTTWA